MTLPYAATLGSLHSHSDAVDHESAALKPLMKKIKRTSFPDWEDGPSPKRASPTPAPPQPIGTSRLAMWRVIQDAQDLQEQQRLLQNDTRAAAPVAEDSGSEYNTSSSTGSDDGSGSDLEGSVAGTRAPDRSTRAQETGEDGKNNSTSSRDGGEAITAREASVSRNTYDSIRADSPAVASNSNVAQIGYEDSPKAARVVSDVRLLGTYISSQEMQTGQTSDFEDENPRVYRHLNSSELEAKIRMDSELARQGRESAERHSIPVSFLGKGGPHGEIYTTEDGRFYTSIIRPDGSSSSTGAVPIPTNYQLHSDPDNPYICPVRECRKCGPSLAYLSGHFSASHNRTTFNDNLDGTLSKVGHYVKGPGLTSPGIVVSRGAPPPGTSPPAIPTLKPAPCKAKRSVHVSRADAGAALRRKARSDSKATESPVPLPTRLVVPKAHDDPLKYLMSLLDSRQELWRRRDIQALAGYPRQRDLPKAWINYHRKTLLDVNHLSCALAYIVGDEITQTSDQCFAPRFMTSRLSERCIQLPEDLSETARMEFSKVNTCVACRYYCILQRRRNICAWSGEKWPPGTADHGTDDMDLDTASPGRENSEERSPASVNLHTVRPAARRSCNSQASSGLRHSTTFSDDRGSEVSASQLEMEDWEFAPGRLLNNEKPAQNVAFSNSYLTSREPVTVSDDISFNVAILSSGSTVHFSVEGTKLRTCSVAAGKVKVKIGETEFKIGPHGMFKVMPGESCVVENRYYMDAYIHCTTVDNYELAP